jgi:hypothetical protein
MTATVKTALPTAPNGFPRVPLTFGLSPGSLD